jgi:DNA sulfur modification protein DndD
MIFERIRIDNLFAYCGAQELDLRSPEHGRNIVLIAGRNGYGKTSLLNSVKLLFTGVTEEMRRAVQRQRVPSPKQYVLGAGNDWWGLMNRRARMDGRTECGIRIEWREQRGMVTVERRWHMLDNDFTHNLELKASFLDAPLQDDDAQRFLDQSLPGDYVPFFFFDGEQIQELAEANRLAQQQHMERLLNIASLETLRQNLALAISDWKREAMDQEERARLEDMYDGLKHTERRHAAGEQRRNDLLTDIERLEDDSRQLQRKLDGLRAFVQRQDEQRLKQEQHHLRDDLGQLLAKIADVLPRDIPLLVNTQLVSTAVGELSNAVHSEGGVQGEMLADLKAHLPRDLFDRPPHSNPEIRSEQREFYRRKLLRLLSALETPPEHLGSGRYRLELGRAKELLEHLQRYTGADALRAERADDLRRAQDIKRRLRTIDAELTNISALSSQEQALYEQLKSDAESLAAQLIDHKAELRHLDAEQTEIATSVRKQRDAIASQQEKVRLSEQAARKVTRAQEFREFFEAFKAELKRHRRSDIEQAINRNYARLMTAHRLVAYIAVGEDFDLQYRDAEGRVIGMGNLSAGMKQLTATALLWALKEVSGRPVPLVIDTPLARIDREHQQNLLVNYYPCAGEQVIILPTDSELDATKYRILKPHVYKEFKLFNRTGDCAIVEEQALYPESAVASYG